MEQVSAKTEGAGQSAAERLAMVAAGQATIAQAAGLSKTQLYEIANKGYLLFSQGKLEDARRIYEGLVAADPFDSVFHCHLGAVLWRLGDTERAFEEYDAAVRFNIANVDALAGRGELLVARGEIEKGFEDLNRALEIDPKCTRPSAQRVRALLFSMREAAKAKRQA
jgi:tetratricopeptide (TPR) repeat protein